VFGSGLQGTQTDQLLAGTSYEGYARAVSVVHRGVADVHNLVTLSRFPIRASRELLHEFFPPFHHRLLTAVPAEPAPRPMPFHRPLLVVDIELPGGERLQVVNVHLRAPLAASVPGQKLAPFAWKSVGGWAEGYFLASLQRAGQALE